MPGGYRAASSRGPTALYATKKDLVVSSFNDDEDAEVEPAADTKLGLYPWVVLGITVLVRVMVQWQRSIFSYAYGYTGTGI